jgi:hypothetical protein
MRDTGSAVNVPWGNKIAFRGERSPYIFSQDFFDAHPKIKFRFFLVALARGF